MIKIIIADKNRHSPQIRELLQEYLLWLSPKVSEAFGAKLDTDEMLDSTMEHLDWFMPPKGRILLGYADENLVGIAYLKELITTIGEVKRMYVRPANRKQGVGRALLNRLLDEARRIGYERVRLDSAPFMPGAHRLYRSVGFREIEAYEGSEIPPEFQQHCIFMEIELALNTGSSEIGKEATFSRSRSV